MKDFLKKYLNEEQLKDVETKYLADHPDAKNLPIFISKSRLDEVLSQKKAAEEASANYAKSLKEAQDTLDTKTAEAVKKALEDAKKESDNKIAAMQRDLDTTEAIYKAHGRNVKAIKALIDNSKELKEEIERLKKEESYLFNDDSQLPTGTGKTNTSSGEDVSKEEAAMRKAVGL